MLSEKIYEHNIKKTRKRFNTETKCAMAQNCYDMSITVLIWNKRRFGMKNTASKAYYYGMAIFHKFKQFLF